MPLSLPGDLANPGIEPASLAFQEDSLLQRHQGSGVPEFNSILTLTTWSWYQISQVMAQSPLQTQVASLRLSSALLTYPL